MIPRHHFCVLLLSFIGICVRSQTTSDPGTTTPRSPKISAADLSDRYEYHPTLDSVGGDIGQFNGDLQAIATACDSCSECLGFVSNGWLKKTIKAQSAWSVSFSDTTKGLYIKRTNPPISTVPTPPTTTTTATTSGNAQTTTVVPFIPVPTTTSTSAGGVPITTVPGPRFEILSDLCTRAGTTCTDPVDSTCPQGTFCNTEVHYSVVGPADRTPCNSTDFGGDSYCATTCALIDEPGFTVTYSRVIEFYGNCGAEALVITAATPGFEALLAELGSTDCEDNSSTNDFAITFANYVVSTFCSLDPSPEI